MPCLSLRVGLVLQEELRRQPSHKSTLTWECHPPLTYLTIFILQENREETLRFIVTGHVKTSHFGPGQNQPP
jgi:hypothetical protein